MGAARKRPPMSILCKPKSASCAECERLRTQRDILKKTLGTLSEPSDW